MEAVDLKWAVQFYGMDWRDQTGPLDYDEAAAKYEQYCKDFPAFSWRLVCYKTEMSVIVTREAVHQPVRPLPL